MLKIVSSVVTICLLVFALSFVEFDSIGGIRPVLRVDLIMFISLCLVGNVIIVSFRLHRLLAHFLCSTGFLRSFQASVAGLVGSLFVFQIVGVVVGRQAVLRRNGITPSLVALATGYERIVMALVAGSLCTVGAIILFGGDHVATVLGRISLVEIVLAIALAIGIKLSISRSRFERGLIASIRDRDSLAKLGEIAGISLSGQLLMLVPYVLGLRAMGADGDDLTLFAAAAVVSFAASVPISVNGWGVREVAALQVFGMVGLEPTEAVALSIIIGLCSTLAVALSTPVLLWKQAGSQADLGNAMSSDHLSSSNRGRFRSIDAELWVAWLVVQAVAVLVFFQIQMDLAGGRVTINLADPVALLTLAVFGMTCVLRREMPAWAIPSFNRWLIVMFLILCAAFAHGAFQFGVTSWALNNRLIGWMFLIGFLFSGAFIIHANGTRSIRSVADTLISAAAAVVVVHYAARLATIGGWFDLPIPYDFEGYSANRNAFAFLLLITLIFAIVVSPIRVRTGQRVVWAALVALVLLGLWQSQSRAGLGTAAILLCFAFFLNLGDRRLMAMALAGAVGLQAMIAAIAAIGSALTGAPAIVQSGGLAVSHERYTTAARAIGTLAERDSQRWLSIVEGARMWLDHPIFGAGLGAFIQENFEHDGLPLVIHNSAIWMLAEFGILGAAPFFVFLAVVAWAGWRVWRTPRGGLLVLLALVFAVFSQVHDIAYQRPFWFALGVAAAVPWASRRAYEWTSRNAAVARPSAG